MKQHKLIDYELFYPASANVTERGIEHNNNLYTCSTAIKQEWFMKARRGAWDVPIFLDRMNDEYVLVQIQNNCLSVAYKIEEGMDAVENHKEYFAIINSLKHKIMNRRRPII